MIKKIEQFEFSAILFKNEIVNGKINGLLQSWWKKDYWKLKIKSNSRDEICVFKNDERNGARVVFTHKTII